MEYYMQKEYNALPEKLSNLVINADSQISFEELGFSRSIIKKLNRAEIDNMSELKTVVQSDNKNMMHGIGKKTLNDIVKCLTNYQEEHQTPEEKKSEDNITGQRIRELREYNHLTQNKLASMMGYKTNSAIAKIESGKSGVSSVNLQRFAQILNTNVDYLTGKTDDPACVLPHHQAKDIATNHDDMPSMPNESTVSEHDDPKIYVLDTNVLLNDPQCLYAFKENTVMLTSTNCVELDNHKRDSGDTGYNARAVIRLIDKIREQGDLVTGVPLPDGGMLKVEPDGISEQFVPRGYDLTKGDDQIISTCVYLKRQNPDKRLVLVSDDANMRIRASICGIEVQPYERIQIQPENYTGRTSVEVSPDAINALYANGIVHDEDLTKDLTVNEFVTLKSGSQSALAEFRGGNLNLIKEQNIFGGAIKPLNSVQSFAIWALMQPAETIPLVILSGAAGSAKTFLSLACGLAQLSGKGNGNAKKGSYARIMLTRPSGGVFSNLGYLPGDIEEKLNPLYAAFYDNLDVIRRLAGDKVPAKEDLINNEKLEIGALDFIRGRSLSDVYMICDEAQNASRWLIRDVITRAGRGTKVVICGDPKQIDNPLLNTRNNGLVYAMKHMKGSPLCAIIAFDSQQTVRSPLSKEAAERL